MPGSKWWYKTKIARFLRNDTGRILCKADKMLLKNGMGSRILDSVRSQAWQTRGFRVLLLFRVCARWNRARKTCTEIVDKGRFCDKIVVTGSSLNSIFTSTQRPDGYGGPIPDGEVVLPLCNSHYRRCDMIISKGPVD